MSYPAFTPPEFAAHSAIREWTEAQAKGYFEWLLATKQSRIKNLLTFAGATALNGEDQIRAVDRFACDAVSHAALTSTYRNGTNLSAQGWALGADCGLFVAQVLSDRFPGSLQWVLCRYGGVTYDNFNQLILHGFHLDVNPIRKGIIIVQKLVSRPSEEECSRLIASLSLEVGPACAAQIKIRGKSKKWISQSSDKQ